MFKRLALAAALSAGSLLAIAGSVAAEEAWLAEMPSVTKVIESTQGSNAFDTAARQWVAFNNLFGTTQALIGPEMTTAQRELRDSYLSNRDRVLRELKESLPPEERDFYIGTRFAEWTALQDRYLADPGFNETLLAKLFSSGFRTANSTILTDQWVFPGGSGLTPGPRPSISRDLATTATNLLAEWGLVILFFVGSIVGGIAVSLGLRSRMELDGADVFKARKGNTTYQLPHSTGVVESSQKLGTTQVYGSSGSVYTDGAGNVTSTPGYVGSTTTIHDQFFLRQSNGHLEPIQLADWDVPVANGHVVSVVWSVTNGGDRRAAAVVNHTTQKRYSRINSAFPIGDHAKSDGSYILVLLGCAAVVFGAATVTAAQAGAGFWLYPALIPASIVTLVAALIGRSQSKQLAGWAALSRFKRKDFPRVYKELDREASQLTPA